MSSIPVYVANSLRAVLVAVNHRRKQLMVVPEYDPEPSPCHSPKIAASKPNGRKLRSTIYYWAAARRRAARFRRRRA